MAYHDKEGDTIRCTDCMLLVPESSAASCCHHCKLYRKTLFSLSLTTKVGREELQMVVTPAATQTTCSCQLPKRMSNYNAVTICTATISKRSLVCELPWSALLSRDVLLWMMTCTRISKRLSNAMTSASAILIRLGHLLACSGRIRCVHLQ